MKKNIKEKSNRREMIATAVAGAAGLILATSCSDEKENQKETKTLKSVSPQKMNDEKKFLEEPIDDLFEDEEILDETVEKITFGREQDDEWQRIKKEIEHSFNFTDDGKLKGKLKQNFARIESGFLFDSMPMDDEFSIFHVEPLIDQAADLLDRGLKDRADWDELGVKYFNLALELQEYRELDEIHQEEEEAGLYDFPAEISDAEYRAELSNKIGNNSNYSWSKKLRDNVLNYARFREVSTANQRSAWLGGQPILKWSKSVFKGYHELTYHGVTDKALNFYREGAKIQNDFTHDNLWYNGIIQRNNYRTAKKVSEKRLDAYKTKKLWDAKNVNFQKRRTLVSRKYQDLKSKSAVDKEGLLNYQKRLIPLKVRFNNDFRDAVARLKVVEKGLKLIYDYDYPLPKDEHDVNYFDNCLLWTRSVIQWLIKFSRKEMNTIYPISVKSLLSKEEWKEGLETGRWKIDVGDRILGKMQFVRLRGFGSYFVDRNKRRDNSILQLLVQVPKVGKTKQTGGKIATLNQGEFSPCILGRVSNRHAARSTDILGATTLFNTSPIGEWTIEVMNEISLRKAKNIKDLIIELHLSYHWKNV